MRFRYCKRGTQSHLTTAQSIVPLIIVLIWWSNAVAAGGGPGTGVELVNPYPAGGPAEIAGITPANNVLRAMQNHAAPPITDVLAQHLRQALSVALDTPVALERRSRQRGMEGQRYVAHAQPDGRVLLFAGSAALFIRSRGPLREFRPVAFVAHMPMVLITASESNATSVRQFVEQARAAPGKSHLGSAGELTASHLTGELFRRVTGTALERVSFNGGSAAVRGVITKQIEAAFVPLPAVLPYAANARLRPLAIVSAARHPALKGVPTMHEAGIAGVDLSAWYGLFAPAATPRDVIGRIHAALAPELQSVETQRLTSSQGLHAARFSHEEFVELVRADSLRWTMLREHASVR